jgi:radical SAM protein with 4Fe4S-binding SPASM domain
MHTDSAPYESSSNRFELRQVYLLLTRQCNLTCSHCIRSSTPFHREMMETQLALRILQQLHDIRREATLLISGGEPTLHPDFKRIVSTGLTQFHRVVVNTNGLRLAPLLEACEHPAASVQISIDGDEVGHDRIRGRGTFRKTLANIEELTRYGIPVTVATTVTQQNLDTILSLDSKLVEARFVRWNVKRVVGSGRASDNDDVTTPAWNHFVAKLRGATRNADRLHISFMFSEAGILAASDRDVATTKQSIASTNCGTGRSKLYVNPNGTVYPCACMESRIVGNFAMQAASDILQALDNLGIETAPDAACRLCPAWEICRGGCPGAAMRTATPALGDPRCPLATAGRRDARLIDTGESDTGVADATQ